MSRTNAELYTLVSEELGIISGQNPLTPDDSDKISRRASSVRAWLIDEGWCYWQDGSIPEAVFLPLAQIIAGQAADVFGRGPKSEDPYTMGDSGFEALKRHVSKRSSREPVQAEYF